MTMPGGRLAGRFILGSLAWSFSGELAARAAVLVTTFIAVRALDPASFGQYVALSATMVLAASLWDFGGSPLLTRELAAGRLSTRSAVSQIAQLRVRTLMFWLAAIVIGSALVGRDQSIGASTILVFAAASLVFSGSLVPLAMLRAKGRFALAGLALSIGRWSTTGASLLGILLAGSAHEPEALAVAVLVGEVVTLTGATIGAYRFRFAVVAGGPVGAPVISLRAASPFATNGLLALAYNRMDVIVVAALTTVQQVGAYAPASRIQDALYVVPSTIGLVAFPIIARTWTGLGGREHAQRLVGQLMLGGLMVALPVAILGTIFAPQAVRLVLGADYEASVAPLRILVWFLPLAVIQAPLIAALGACGRASDTTKIFAITFVVAILMHLCLDWRMGATGAAIASLSRDIAATPIAILFARRSGILLPYLQDVSLSIKPSLKELKLSSFPAPAMPIVQVSLRILTAIVFVMVLLVTGAAVSMDLTIAAIPIGMLILVPIVASRQVMLLFIVLGGLVALQSSQGLSFIKLGYLAGFGLIVLVAILNQNKKEYESLDPAIYPLLKYSWLIVVLIALSIVVSVANGTNVTDWLRDAAPYMLFSFIPAIAMNLQRSTTERWLIKILLIAGLIGTLSYAIHWLDRRNFIDIGIDKLVLSSFLLPAATFSYAASSATIGKKNRLKWTAIAILIASMLLLTGTRSSLVLLAALPVLIFRSKGNRISRTVRVSVGSLILASVASILTLSIANAVDADVGRLTERFTSLGDFLQGQEDDQSYAERAAQTRSTWEAFKGSPVLGTGLGFEFEWATPWRVSGGAFTIDSPLTFPAKLGMAGVIALAFVVVGYYSLLKAIPTTDMTAVPKASVICFAAIVAAWSILGSPFEDKGMSFGLLILLTLLLSVVRESTACRAPVGVNEPRPQMDWTAAAGIRV